jgi:hypothetical protein
VTTRDPLFTEQDIEEALALVDYEAENCAGCGFPKTETFDPDNEGAYRGVVVACHACAARERAKKQLDDLDGVYSFAVKRERRTHG